MRLLPTGMIMSVAALLDVVPNPTDAEINDAISNTCRCGTYNHVRAAIHLTAADNTPPTTAG